MLTAHHIYKNYGIHPVLEDISCSISNHERVGLIGPNGCGKTTLMRILAEVHDRYFIEHFASDVWAIRDGKVEKW